MVKINGGSAEYCEKTVADVLKETGLSAERVAVELNGRIVPRAQYSGTILKDGDTLEIVTFVGGG